MKKFALAVAMTTAFSMPCLAETEFRGGLCFESVNAACTAVGWNAGSCFNVRYAPRNVGTNGADTELSLFSGSFSVGFRLALGNPVVATPYTVDAFKVARGGHSHPLGFRLTSHVPAAPTTATPNITMAGFFTNWDEATGCTVSFRAAVTRQ